MPFFEDYGDGFSWVCLKSINGGKMPITHMHPHYELYLCLEPQKQYTVINGRQFNIEKACAILHSPYSIHKTEVFDTVIYKRYVFYFGSQMLDNYSENVLPLHKEIKKPAYIVLIDEYKVRKILTLLSLFESYPADKNAEQLIFLLIFNEIFIVKDRKELFDTQSIQQTYIYEVIQYIVLNINKPLSLSGLAQHFFISKDKLCYDFKKYTTITIRQFIIELRVNYAKNLLEYSNLPIGEIASACGFESEYYFYPFFRSHIGITPLQYRYSREKIRLNK